MVGGRKCRVESPSSQDLDRFQREEYEKGCVSESAVVSKEKLP